MAVTRAIQSDFLLAGLTDESGNLLAGGYVWFKLAGTDTDADGLSGNAGVYLDKEKQSSAGVKVQLDSLGRKQLYFDGVYKFKIYDGDPDSGGTLIKTYDNIKLKAHDGAILSKSSEYTISVDDDFVGGDVSGGAFTMYLPPSANTNHPVVIKKTDSSANAITVDADSSETIDGSATKTLSRENETVRFWPIPAGSGWYTESVDAETVSGYSVSESATASTLAARDSNGDITANEFFGDLTGDVTGDVSGQAGSVAIHGCSVYAQSGGTSLPSGSITSLSFTNEIFDTDSMWSSGTNITIPSSPAIQYARISATVEFQANATGFREVYIYRNGSVLATILGRAQHGNPTIGATGSTFINVTSGVVKLAANDIITIRALQNSGGSLSAVSYVACVELLGALAT